MNFINIKLLTTVQKYCILIYLRSACHYIANIQRFMDSEISNCFDILTIFKGSRHLTVHKQPK